MGADRRILVLECLQEVSTFNPVRSGPDAFDVRTGDAFFEAQRGHDTEVGGALAVFDDAGVTAIPGFGAWSYSSTGPLSADGFRELAAGFLEAVRAHPDIDGIYACLHGSMVAADEPDPEGYLLAETRRIVGEDVPIVVSLDLHGVLTRRMLREADAVVCYLTYPHVDLRSTGERAARLLLRILEADVRPVTARVTIPALVRGEELITETGSFGRLTRRAADLEAGAGGLSAGILISNPFTDVPELQSSAFVTTDGDPDRAAAEALALATDFWTAHESMVQPLISLDEAVTAARETRGGTIILTDAADATSSGASGDSNAIVAALVAAGYRGAVLAPVVDAPAVRAAVTAGVGNRVTTTIGGQADPARFTPMTFEGVVSALGDGVYRSESDGLECQAGPTAVLTNDVLTIVATSRPVMLHDRSLFLAHGLDPRDFDAVVVKSPRCEPRLVDAWAARTVHVDAPGSTSANLRSLGHVRCPRPIFPLDDDVPFEPVVELYSRPRYRVLTAAAETVA